MHLHRLNGMILIAMIIVALVGCSKDSQSPVGPTTQGNAEEMVQATCPVPMTESAINQAILNVGVVKWILPGRLMGSNGGECKAWAQSVVNHSLLRPPVTVANPNGVPIQLPLNSSDLSRWSSTNDWQYVYAVEHQVHPAKACLVRFPLSMQPGRIVQASVNYSSGGTGPHTFIVEQRTDDKLYVLESNWYFDHTVRRHTYTLNDWAKYYKEWTVYQVTGAIGIVK